MVGDTPLGTPKRGTWQSSYPRLNSRKIRGRVGRRGGRLAFFFFFAKGHRASIDEARTVGGIRLTPVQHGAHNRPGTISEPVTLSISLALSRSRAVVSLATPPRERVRLSLSLFSSRCLNISLMPPPSCPIFVYRINESVSPRRSLPFLRRNLDDEFSGGGGMVFTREIEPFLPTRFAAFNFLISPLLRFSEYISFSSIDYCLDFF